MTFHKKHKQIEEKCVIAQNKRQGHSANSEN